MKQIDKTHYCAANYFDSRKKMREILFRGKGVNCGIWCEGNLIQTKEIAHIFIPSHGEGYEVYPETVGQYTGLKDKNGKRIFEGDIVRLNESNCYAHVCFVDGAWWILSNEIERFLNDFRTDDLQILGNFHDNPELLYEERG